MNDQPTGSHADGHLPLPDDLGALAEGLNDLGIEIRNEPEERFEARLLGVIERSEGTSSDTKSIAVPGRAASGRRRSRAAAGWGVGALAACVLVAVLLVPTGMPTPASPQIASVDDDALLLASFEVLDDTLAWADDSLDEIATSVDGLRAQEQSLTPENLDTWLDTVGMEQPL
ncbi:MAG: hypothetical protein AAGH71_05020 [Planctomycetota bacterium]